MRLTIEMHDPAGHIMDELTLPLYRGMTQDSVAITYAYCIAQLHPQAPEFRQINAAIRARWKGKAALERVKKAAWKHVEYWHAKVRAHAQQ